MAETTEVFLPFIPSLLNYIKYRKRCTWQFGLLWANFIMGNSVMRTLKPNLFNMKISTRWVTYGYIYVICRLGGPYGEKL